MTEQELTVEDVRLTILTKASLGRDGEHDLETCLIACYRADEAPMVIRMFAILPLQPGSTLLLTLGFKGRREPLVLKRVAGATDEADPFFIGASEVPLPELRITKTDTTEGTDTPQEALHSLGDRVTMLGLVYFPENPAGLHALGRFNDYIDAFFT